ncbi:hypothetical protein ACS0TY_014389 [Phlomoides rotata]
MTKTISISQRKVRGYGGVQDGRSSHTFRGYIVMLVVLNPYRGRGIDEENAEFLTQEEDLHLPQSYFEKEKRRKMCTSLLLRKALRLELLRLEL